MTEVRDLEEGDDDAGGTIEGVVEGDMVTCEGAVCAGG